MTIIQQRKAAKEFSAQWKGKGYEKGESQPFWLTLLRTVFGIEQPENFIQFEDQVRIDHTSFIDARIPSTNVLIEQKGIGKDLQKSVKQSDGSYLTPFQQAKRYASELPYSKRPRWIVTCNFQEFLVYDMEHPTGDPELILLTNLEKEFHRLNFLVDSGDESIRREMEISLKAGELVGKLYDALLERYVDSKNEHSLKSLNALCVRLVFCLYAEDAGVFGKHHLFHDYLKSCPITDIREALIALFKILDTKIEDRDPYLKESLAVFPYVNGGLFSDEDIEIPRFTEPIVKMLLNNCSENFDWSGISPTIFGSVFESTLNPETRRNGGMHYTSIENIHKVIDPLFLNDLRKEFEEIKAIKVSKIRNGKLSDFQQKMASLLFLDPACGSGNFLTETYISLRRLENETITLLKGDKHVSMGGDFSPIKVSINQFYGIEVNDFAVTVAKTALWIAEAQMIKETEDIVQTDLNYLPLKSYGHIVEGDALTLDWRYLYDNDRPDRTVIFADSATINIVNDPIAHYGKIDLFTKEVVSTNKAGESLKPIHYDYIMGNPPFVGARLMNHQQKESMLNVFGNNWRNVGNMDYVCAWYKKTADFIQGSDTRCAFVSTNSICQGEQVPNLWKPLFAQGIHIDFACRTFRWDSESKLKAHVHCIIVGFSCTKKSTIKTIFSETGHAMPAKYINAYLIDAENTFVENRNEPICLVPKMDFGNMPNDSKGLLSNYSQAQKEELCKKYPELEKYFRRLLGAEEFINRKIRYCLWFKGADLSIIRKCPEIHHAVEKVRKARANSPRQATQKLADFPYLFGEIRQPETDYLLIPCVSSERRKYIPIGFISSEIIVNDSVLIIPNATLYHFGILTSNIHHAWMRVVCGRLKSDYRYSKSIVYNTFPWAAPTDAQKEKIEETAKQILEARNMYPDSSFADLYDEATMPPELRKAHQANDKAVMSTYGFPFSMTETECVAELMKRYQKMIDQHR